MNKYTNKDFYYTNPKYYDERSKLSAIDGYLNSLWRPVLLKSIKKLIKKNSVVCDLGCGTFEYTQYMNNAKKIFAVDINKKMLDYGIPKIKKIKKKVVILCEDALKTSIPDNSCDLVWINGLSEYVDINGLFKEIKRISKPHSKLLILFPNKVHPYNFFINIINKVMYRSGKNFRTIFEFNKKAELYGFNLENMESMGIFLYIIPSFLQKYLTPLWYLLDKLYAPFQKTFPIGVYVFGIFEKS